MTIIVALVTNVAHLSLHHVCVHVCLSNIIVFLSCIIIFWLIMKNIWGFIPQGKSDFSKENARRSFDFSGGKKCPYLPNVHAINCLLHRTTGDNLECMHQIQIVFLSLVKQYKKHSKCLLISFLKCFLT